ncbi:Gfo/Idh/MocA family protein [Enterococcus sp. CSURQ0835]|uniref:Gfo/Idh/MocA family protein n=1 Tax=Enterococcus sp. CSURQ0835 TaxID=2681394 RepID=UPI00135BFEED|nr:Gfo/Idh/MocA family oxidoreductase [Enterococcus sp. CSURQ0835]
MVLKIGIIGCGGIANGKHLPALVQVEGVELCAFCDVISDRAERAFRDFGTANSRVFTDYQEMLNKEELDVVHVCTPNISHAEISIAAMKAGCHVMCEKPMAKTSQEAQAMIHTSKVTGKKLTIGYQNRFRADSRYLHKVCHDGDLGEIYFGKAHAVRRRAVPTWGVFLDEEAQGGGALIDIGTHALDLTLWMMNNYRPKYVVGKAYHQLSTTEGAANAWGPWEPEKFKVEDSAFGFVMMENGTGIFLESSWALNSLEIKEAKTSLYGSKGGADMNDGLTINGEEQGLLYQKKIELQTGGVDFYDGRNEDPALEEAKFWIESIVNDTEPLVKPEEALVVTQILEAIYESSNSGKPVFL